MFLSCFQFFLLNFFERLLEAGRQNQAVAQTRLNHESSRSHCLFQLKIVRRVKRDRWAVTSLAFCDLAGAERSKKVGNNRERLAESKTINKSLLQLGVVIEDLRRNQSKPGTVAVSFRNSKECFIGLFVNFSFLNSIKHHNS